MIRNIPFNSSLNLDSSENPRNFFKEKPLKKRPMAHFQECLTEEDIGIPVLIKKDSSMHIETKIPYSEIPCLKCLGKREKKDGKPCKKCDGSGKMKNSKKLRKIEYLIDKKLQALLTELENRKFKSEILKNDNFSNKTKKNLYK